MATLPLLAAFASALFAFAGRNWRFSSVANVAASGLQLLLATYFVYETAAGGRTFHSALGAWPAPFGISFYLDSLSALMIWISAFLFFVVHLYALGSPEFRHHPWAHALCWNTLAVGVIGSFSTNDLFNLFVWFEVLLLSSYVLFTWSFTPAGTEAVPAGEGRKGLISYIVLNIVGSSIFLFGLALLYSSTGTLNFADLMSLPRGAVSPALGAAAFCLLFAFSMKAAFFPLFNWLPAAYPSGPISSVALFAGLLTKVGIYALLRFFLPPSALHLSWIAPLMMVCADLTMLLGVYGAATSQTLRTILSFHVVSQVGYMALGFAVGTEAALSATIFYLLHHMVVKTNLFLIAGAVEKARGTDDLKHLGGLIKTNPWLAGAFAVSALSLAGIPPFSGFWAKLFVLLSAFQEKAYLGAAVGFFVGLFTLYSMLKIWNEVFLKPAPAEGIRSERIPRVYTAAILLLSLWTVALGLYPVSLSRISDQAAAKALDASSYLETLRGGRE